MTLRFLDELVIDPETWQTRLLTLILRATVVLGFLVYLPSVYAAVQSGLPGIVILDTVALAAIVGLYLCDGIPARRRATIYCLICYVLAVGLLVTVGSISQIYLFGFSILTTLLLGLRAGFYSALLSSATLLTVGLLGYASPEMVVPHWNYQRAGWVAITLNFALVDIVLTLAVGAVLAALEAALTRAVAARVSLESERALLRTLIDTLPDVVFTKDTTGRYVSCNPAALAQMGFENQNELAGKTAFDLYPHDVAKLRYADDMAVIAGRPLRNREDQGSDRAGNPTWYLTTKVPLRDADGVTVGLIGISRDMTDRKLAEAERVRLLGQLQLQIERMPLAYLLTDASFHYTRWNPTAERMFGYSQAEVIGKHPFDVIVPPHAQAWQTGIFDSIKAGGMEAHGESENRTRDGRTILCEWHNTPLFEEGGAFVGLLSLAQDVTGRKTLEDQLRQSQKMEAIGQLAGGVAHDFNNLLTIITGYSEMLLAMPETGDDVREAVKPISEASGRAAALTRQLLGFSRQTMLQPQVLDINTVVAETGNMLRRLIGEDILFATVLAPDLSRVKVDPGQLDQVLMNLALNARDAMPRGGKLTIETGNVFLSDDYAASHLDCAAGHHVMLAMTDTGSGMPPEVMAHIFEPFFTTKEVGKGSGLGLAMVFGIVQQSAGCVHVYSEPGHGTTFKVYLPAASEPLTVRREPDAKAAVRGTETILLVEDEELVRNLALTSLRRHGYTVLPAADGRDALNVVHAHAGPIDLILSDVVMPHVSGPELAGSLKAQFPRIKVLFMSGYTDDAVVRHGLLEADVSFIQKPYTPLGLARKVRQVLDASAGT